jgi:hypothetical protein
MTFGRRARALNNERADELRKRRRRASASARELPGALELRRLGADPGSQAKADAEATERLAEVLGVEGAARNMPEIIEKALDLALEKKDPKAKLERRRKREAARAETRPGEASRETRRGRGGRGDEARDIRARWA